MSEQKRDFLTTQQRSALMSRIRQKDTDIEVRVRSALHRSGYRFRKHVPHLPGKPDIVFPGAAVAVFIDGDFWHGHDFEAWRDRLKPYWRNKIERNMERDAANRRDLEALGWRVLRVRQHEIKRDFEAVVGRIAAAVDEGEVRTDNG